MAPQSVKLNYMGMTFEAVYENGVLRPLIRFGYGRESQAMMERIPAFLGGVGEGVIEPRIRS